MKTRFLITYPPEQGIKLTAILKESNDVREILEMIGKGFILRAADSKVQYKEEEKEFHVELELSPATTYVILDSSPFYERWWYAIKAFWLKNSNPELWKDV